MEYTRQSKEILEEVFEAETAEEAVRLLRARCTFRTLPEKLMKVFSGTEEDLQKTLKDGFFLNHTDAKERDSIRKLLPSWFQQKEGVDDRTISRAYAFEICFILQLPLETAEAFITSVTAERIHYRNPEELTAAYSLSVGKGYRECADLQEKAGAILAEEPDGPDNEMIEYTYLIRQDLEKIHDDESFLAYLRNNRRSFVETQNTAYAYFLQMLNVLLKEGTDASVGELVRDNLYRRYLPEKKSRYSIVKSVSAGWPEETQISKMKNRETWVTRKVLILLFLASGGGLTTDPDDEMSSLKDDFWVDEEDDGSFEGILTQLNAMLSDCGYSVIDPRHPFDWIVLFCIATGDLFDIDERFGDILSILFGKDFQD